MEYLLEPIYTSTRILRLVGKPNEFEQWLWNSHSIEMNARLLEGHKLFIICAFQDLFHSIASSEHFPLISDRLLHSAVGNASFPIEKLPESCERTIFLKNVWNRFKPVQRARTVRSLQSKLDLFFEEVMEDFERLISDSCSLNLESGLSMQKIEQGMLIDSLFIDYNQILSNSPVAYHGTLQKNYRLSSKRLLNCFEGYKYTLQFVWRKVLGKDWFESTSLKCLHTSDSWNKYTYLPSKLPEDASMIEKIVEGNHFEINAQSSLDSYFWRIKDEIVDPMGAKGLHPRSFENQFQINRKNISEFKFSEKLLVKTNEQPQLTEGEKIDIALYWRQYDVIDTGSIYTGASAFITSLVGTAGLFDHRHREFDKVIVARFIHPAGEKRNTYSYGILIDSMAAADHYSSGWLIYNECGNDFSGFGGGEHRKAEEFIAKYEKEGILEIRELIVGRSEFEKHLARYMQENQLVANRNRNKKEKQILQLTNATSDFVGKSKSLVFELMVYYAMRQYYHSSVDVSWSVNKKDGEMDVLVKGKDMVRLIECKLTPDNNELIEAHIAGQTKLNELVDLGNKVFEFWFWNEPSIETVRLLNSKSIRHYSFSSNLNLPDEFRGVSMKLFRQVLNFSHRKFLNEE